MRVTILGCGASSGTPAVDRGWGKCDPDNPRNRRLRPSILVEDATTRILVDTTPDLRQQLLGVGVNRLDAVVYTHAHADHLHGIDDLRAINRTIEAPLDIHANAETLDVIGQRFGYVFEPLAEDAKYYYKPTLIAHRVDDGDTFEVGRIAITAFEQDHGYGMSLGFRFGPIAYATDMVELPDSAFTILEGVEVWIAGVLGERPHPTHAHLDKVLDWAGRIKAKRTILTHMDVVLDYAELGRKLPAGVEVAYDGMVIETEGEEGPD